MKKVYIIIKTKKIKKNYSGLIISYIEDNGIGIVSISNNFSEFNFITTAADTSPYSFTILQSSNLFISYVFFDENYL